MTNHPDIIGIVKELQNEFAILKECKVRSPQMYDELESAVMLHVFNDFAPIAQALFDRDEKLQIAVEALEKIENVPPTELADDIAAFANNALTRIKSLPTP